VYWIRHLVGNGLRLLLHPSVLGRFALLGAFLRIEFKRKILVELCGRRLTSEHVFGQIIHFSDYSIFALVFGEVYLSGVYYFPARVAAPLIIDGGANIGVSLAYFKTIYPGCRVLAFEPNERNFELLQRTVRANGWTNTETYPFGLHRTAGEQWFFDYNGLPGSLSGGFWEPAEAGPAKSKTMVRTIRLSDYINEDVDLLKLDVEGSEMAILEDLMAADKLERVRQIIGEYHHHVKPDEDRLGEFLSLLERAGFGYHLCAALPLPFPQRQAQNFMFSAYRKAAG
jgi:FkbM family methyltransferase